MTRLNQTVYSDFPLRLGSQGVATTDRMAHIRHQIEQVLFTDPGERWFRPDFGAGVRALVFEPNGSALWQITRQRLQASLADALAGEVAPRDLEVEVGASPDRSEQLLITIRYRLTAINHVESLTFEVTR